MSPRAAVASETSALFMQWIVRARVSGCRLRRLTFELTGPEQWGGICASVFASANSGTLCRVRLSEWLGVICLGGGVEMIITEAMILAGGAELSRLLFSYDVVGGWDDDVVLPAVFLAMLAVAPEVESESAQAIVKVPGQ